MVGLLGVNRRDGGWEHRQSNPADCYAIPSYYAALCYIFLSITINSMWNAFHVYRRKAALVNMQRGRPINEMDNSIYLNFQEHVTMMMSRQA